MYIYEKMR